MGDIHGAPRVLLVVGLGVEVMALRVQRSGVGVGCGADAGDAGNARLRAAGVVEKEQVTDRHGAQEITRLVVAHAIPARFAKARQVLDREFVGLGFHQPVGHGWCSRQCLK
ncbi:hypothetical protein D3C72_1825500 [compost metagenome]